MTLLTIVTMCTYYKWNVSVCTRIAKKGLKTILKIAKLPCISRYMRNTKPCVLSIFHYVFPCAIPIQRKAKTNAATFLCIQCSYILRLNNDITSPNTTQFNTHTHLMSTDAARRVSLYDHNEKPTTAQG